jgi:hypothetical protein
VIGDYCNFVGNDRPFSPDGLVVGCGPIVTDSVALAGGQGVLQRGTLLGIVTSTGLAAVCTATATDGSQRPAAVLVSGVDTTAGRVPGSAYFSGEFDARLLAFDSSWTVSALEDAMRARGLFLRTTSALTT